MLLEYHEKLNASKQASNPSIGVIKGEAEPQASTSNTETSTASPDGETTPEPGVPTAPAGAEKREEDRLCVSMWGKRACPGLPECKRKHLPLCDKTTCFGNPENRRACAETDGKWHGHIQLVVVDP